MAILLIPFVASANYFKVGEIAYRITDAAAKTVEVAALSSPSYSGALDIPATVQYENTAYTVTAIGRFGFGSWRKLTAVTIPNSVITIGDGAFSDCQSLTSVTIPESVTSIGGYAFKSCDNLKSIEIPNSVKSIGAEAFNVCKSLTSIVLPNSITEIKDITFNECSSLASVTIPASVTSIGNSAFAYCTALNEVHCAAVTPPVCDMASIYCVGAGMTVFVPAGSVEAYRNDNIWNRFTIVAEPEPEVPVLPAVTFGVGDASGRVGEEIALAVGMNNSVKVTSFQCDIHLPEGFAPVKDEDGNLSIKLSNRKSANHILGSNQLPDGTIRVLVYSTTNSLFDGTEGTLFTIDVEPTTAQPAEYNLTVDGIVAVDENVKQINVEPVTGHILLKPTIAQGDVNGDDEINITDASLTVSHILGNTPEGFLIDKADVNADNTVNVTDVSSIVTIVLGKSTMAKAPRANAADENNGTLSVKDFSIQPGETLEMPVSLTAPRQYSAFQTDIYLPDGLDVVIVDEEGETYPDVWFNPTKPTKSHTIVANLQSDGALRVLAYSNLNSMFKTGTGDVLFYVRVHAAEDFSATPQTVEFKSTIFNAGTDEYRFAPSQSIINAGTTTGLNEVEAAGEAVYYNLQGHRVASPKQGEIYVRVQGGRASKLLKY